MDVKTLGILKYPIYSEKSNIKLKNNIYTMVVDYKANKTCVKHVFEEIFQTKVDSVNIIKKKPKKRKIGKYKGYTSHLKVAIIKLKKGYNLEIFGQTTKATPKEQKTRIEKIKEKLFDVTKNIKKTSVDEVEINDKEKK